MPAEFGAATFLDNYFRAHAQALEAQQQKAQQDQFGQRLAFEQATKQQDFAQRQKEFAQQQAQQAAENAFRQQQLSSTQAFQGAQQHRWDVEDWEKAAKGGMFAIPTPTDTQQTTTLPEPPQPAPANVEAPNPAGPFVAGGQGPSAPLNLGPGPAAPQQFPQQAIVNVPGQFQGPSPAEATPVPAGVVPGGAQPGQSYFQKTPHQLEAEKKQADLETSQLGMPTVTPVMEEMSGHILKAGTKVPQATIDKLLEAHMKANNPEKITNDLENATQAFVDKHGRAPNGDERLAIAHQVHNDSQSDITRLVATLSATQKQTDISKEKMAGELYGEGLLKNPNMPVEKKYESEITKYLQDKGYPGLPKALEPTEATAFSAAGASLKTMDQIAGMLKNTDGTPSVIAQNMGAILGPAQDLGQRLGKDFLAKNPGQVQQMQYFRTLVSGNLVNELKVINPRAAAALLDFVKQMAPNERMEPDMFAGALNGMRQVSYNRIQQSLEKQWGKKIPPESMEQYGTPSRQPIAKEDPRWRKSDDSANFIPKDDTKVVNVGGKRIMVYHDGTNDKFYPLMTAPTN